MMALLAARRTTTMTMKVLTTVIVVVSLRALAVDGASSPSSPQGGDGQQQQQQQSPMTCSVHDVGCSDAMTAAAFATRNAQNQCTLYLAESSYPIADGLGVYTAVDIPSGSHVSRTIPEVVIPLLDFNKPQWKPWMDLLWIDGDFSDLPFENNWFQEEYVSGLGSHLNCHLGLFNVQHADDLHNDAAGLHRSKDPGVGAFAYHHGLNFTATTSIRAGSELFVDYGEQWFVDRVDDTSSIAFAKDYKRADQILRSTLKKYGTASTSSTTNSVSIDSDGTAVGAETTTTTRGLARLRGGGNGSKGLTQAQWNEIRSSINSDRVRSALPEYVPFLNYALEVGTARYSLPDFVRTPSWLEENGWCIDALTYGPSTVPQAGRGAFAIRSIKAGDVIAPMPVTLIPRQDLDVHSAIEDDETGELEFSEDEITGKQLLLNYCFGHPNSDVLLLPTSPAVNYINHAPTTTATTSLSGDDGESGKGEGGAATSNNQRQAANAVIRWSNRPYNEIKWLQTKPHDESGNGLLDAKKPPHLMMEIIALRDIKPNEEVFVDYGRDWDGAWKQHVEHWKAKDDQSTQNYKSAREYLASDDYAIRTLDEQNDRPHPPNLWTACYYQHHNGRTTFTRGGGGGGTTTKNQQQRVHRWSQLQKNYDCLLPCQILSREEGNGGGKDAMTYTAKLTNMKHGEYHSLLEECLLPVDDDDGEEDEQEDYVVSNIPSDAITVVDQPYSSDQFLAGSFRHVMGLPGGVFPEAWIVGQKDR